jgi:hypothetical protein
MATLIVVLALFMLWACITGGLTWVAFYILHQIFMQIPYLTFGQAIMVGIALSIIGRFFKSSNNKE